MSCRIILPDAASLVSRLAMSASDGLVLPGTLNRPGGAALATVIQNLRLGARTVGSQLVEQRNFFGSVDTPFVEAG